MKADHRNVERIAPKKKAKRVAAMRKRMCIPRVLALLGDDAAYAKTIAKAVSQVTR